jgi:hypothetical protein
MPTTFQQLLEQYGMLEKKQRMFYPKNFNLSEGFLKALKEEIALQEKEGIPPEKFSHKLNRALQFHIDEHKKNLSPK